MLSVVAVGYHMKELAEFPSIIWAHHNPSMAIGLSNREYMLLTERIVEQSDVLMVNLSAESLSPDEVVIIHTAYLKRRPIIATGFKTWAPLIEEMVSHRYSDIEMAVDHIAENYIASQ